MGKNTLEYYGTLGPACKEKETLKNMFLAGMTGMRINLSHCGFKEFEPWLTNLYEVADTMHFFPDLLVDLKGPELRIGVLNRPLSLKAGDRVRLRPLSYAEDGEIPVPEILFSHFEKDRMLRLDDGKITLRISHCDKERQEAEACVTVGGILRAKKSLAVEGHSVELPTLTEQDRENLKALHNYRVTGVMLPFVRGSEDLITLKKALLDLRLPKVRIFAKIENEKGMDKLPELLPHCDQIVIARGDLGNSGPVTQVPTIQKQIARVCRMYKKPFMVVTQLLDSMTENPVPTRAEVSDIFNAVLDGASSLMLTGETAEGRYPAEAMQVLSDTAFEAIRYRTVAGRFPI